MQRERDRQTRREKPLPALAQWLSPTALLQCSFNMFHLLIVLARTSSIMLNSSDERRHSYLVSDLKEKTFSLSPLNMMLAMGLS